jgi:hypothetical protein
LLLNLQAEDGGSRMSCITTWHHNPEDYKLNLCHCKNLTFCRGYDDEIEGGDENEKRMKRRNRTPRCFVADTDN